jgi:hypothetical protein
LALLRGLILRTLAWLCTLLRALLGLAGALGLIALVLRALGLSLVLRAVFAPRSLIALVLLLAPLHLIFLILLRLTLRVCPRCV